MYKNALQCLFLQVGLYISFYIFLYIVYFEYQMGQCISSAQRKSATTYRYGQSLQAESPKTKHLSRLSFHSTIANLILKKYPHKMATPEFHLIEGHSFKLPAKHQSGDESIKWKFQQNFDFEMSQYELKKSFLQVQVYNQQNRIVGSIKINLYLIATGPIHQDFAIEYERGRLGRINFDLKLSQIIGVKIRAKSAQIELLKDHPGQEFSYSIKTIAGYNGEASESKCSYPAIVLLEKKILEIQQEKGEKSKFEGYLSIDNDRKKSVKEVETGKHIVWHNQNGELPVLTTKVLASELHNTYFQVLIWKSQGTARQKEELFADTYVSFYKLFATEGIRIGQEGSQLQSRDISIAEKIQHYGKDYGKGTFSFNIANEPYFKQYQICVHTEAGILKTAPIFGEEKAKPTDICSQLKELQHISEKTEQDVIKLNNLYSTQSFPSEIRKVKSQIELNLERMFNFFEKSSHFPFFLYQYNSEGELLEGQKILVEIGMKTIEYLQLEDPIINDVCWLILISLVKRSEFNLGHMGFNQKHQSQLLNKEVSKYLTEKLKLVNIFKNFTYKLLSLALSALNRKGSQYESVFAEVYCACAYFKIPQFRKEVLKLITNQADPEINEWRGVEFNLHDDIEQSYIRRHANIFSELFDWQPHFYRWIANEEQGESLSDILSQKEWKQKFKSRGLQFFYFLKYWVTYIQSNLPMKKDIQWRYFPGYNRLLQGFFAEMKKTPILQYPDALIESCLKLLANEKLVNPIMTIMLNKVNVFNPSAVLRAIEYLNLIFKFFTKKKKFLPIYFNYSYFFKCLKIIFQSESCIGISSALTLIYNYFQLYHIEFRRSLSMYLLGKIFWKLFLHWSYAVRNSFHHLITYRIYGLAYYSKTITSSRFMISDSDIMERYRQIMKIASNKEKEYQQSRLGSFDNFVDQHYFKKMKLKAYHKIRQASDCSSNNITKTSIEVKEFSDIQQVPGRPRKELINEHQLLKEDEGRGYHSQHSSNLKKEMPLQGKAHDDNFWEEPCHQFVLFQKIIHEEELEIQEIDREKLKYLATYLPEFKKIERSFIKSLQKQDHFCPLVSYQISIDNREIRPKEIDNW